MPPRTLYRGDLRRKHRPAKAAAIRQAQDTLAEANRNTEQPYVPGSLSRPYNNEAKRRLKRMVDRELRDLEE
jgi:hypothetical protein